jgi:hypothetical protein
MALVTRLETLLFGSSPHVWQLRSTKTFSSPQHEAFAWMTNADSNCLLSAMSDDELVERFVLVVLCFATDGERWLDQAGFLNPLNARCSWNSWNCGELSGVVCNEEGLVLALDLGEFLHSSTF